MPVLETPDGPLTESSAIARYLASLGSNQSLYPQAQDASDTSRALIDAWIDWATVLDTATKQWVEPIFGQGSQQHAAVQTAKADFDQALQTLDMHLKSCTFLVGDDLTLADLVVVSHLLLLYLTVCKAGQSKMAVDRPAWLHGRRIACWAKHVPNTCQTCFKPAHMAHVQHAV